MAKWVSHLTALYCLYCTKSQRIALKCEMATIKRKQAKTNNPYLGDFHPLDVVKPVINVVQIETYTSNEE